MGALEHIERELNHLGCPLGTQLSLQERGKLVGRALAVGVLPHVCDRSLEKVGRLALLVDYEHAVVKALHQQSFRPRPRPRHRTPWTFHPTVNRASNDSAVAAASPRSPAKVLAPMAAD